MITELQAERFKSWENAGPIRMASLTGMFGTNSSGKTSILQMLLLLKQTAESSDRQRVLHTGDERTYVDLGTFFDIAYAHQVPGSLTLSVAWKLKPVLRVEDPDEPHASFTISELRFSTSIRGTEQTIMGRLLRVLMSDQ